MTITQQFFNLTRFFHKDDMESNATETRLPGVARPDGTLP
jgi:hypothetical protein